MTPSVLAVCVVHQLRPDAGQVGVTAIDKRPVEGPVAVHSLGLHGDVQADRANHGGPDQAIYAYAQESAEVWAQALGRAVPPGLFGENLRTVGVEVDRAVIGERWRVGQQVVLEVTQPRIPCATFARRMQEPHWVKRFTQQGLCGAYLRVLQRGSVQAGDQVQIEHRPAHGVTIGAWFADMGAADARLLLAAEADGHLLLGNGLRRYAERSVAARG